MVCVEPLEYKRNARRGILAIVGALAFVAVCVAMIVASGLASFLGILGLVGAVFFGLVAVAGCGQWGPEGRSEAYWPGIRGLHERLLAARQDDPVVRGAIHRRG